MIQEAHPPRVRYDFPTFPFLTRLSKTGTDSSQKSHWMVEKKLFRFQKKRKFSAPFKCVDLAAHARQWHRGCITERDMFETSQNGVFLRFNRNNPTAFLPCFLGWVIFLFFRRRKFENDILFTSWSVFSTFLFTIWVFSFLYMFLRVLARTLGTFWRLSRWCQGFQSATI